MKVVVDTNVLVSALLNPNGVPAKILNLILNQRLIVLYDSRILHEYDAVLRRPKFAFEKAWVDNLLDYVKYSGEFVIADSIGDPFTDEDDRKFLEVARSGEALYLITGNLFHFPEEKQIVSPRIFLTHWQEG